jgi:hypothetical protein
MAVWNNRGQCQRIQRNPPACFKCLIDLSNGSACDDECDEPGDPAPRDSSRASRDRGSQRSRRVYAPDLPGYGFPDRSPRRYDIALFCDAIRDMLAVIAADRGKQRVDALALSLSAEFLSRA